MEHSFDLSISGRVFSRSGGHEDEDDPFARMLARLHHEAASVGIKGGWHDPVRRMTMFNPRLLTFVSYAVSVYRCDCPPRYWDTGTFIDALNETEGAAEDGAGKWYFAGALLFCVDRALALYQRGRHRGAFNEAEDWANCAQWLRFSLRHFDEPTTESCADLSEKMKALNLARHRSNHAARERVVSEWEKSPSTWPSAEKAGLYFADLLAKEGSTYEPRTVTDWIRTHARKVGIRFR